MSTEAELVARAAQAFCAELQEDAVGVPEMELAHLHDALDQWEQSRTRADVLRDIIMLPSTDGFGRQAALDELLALARKEEQNAGLIMQLRDALRPFARMHRVGTKQNAEVFAQIHAGIRFSITMSDFSHAHNVLDEDGL